MSGLKRHQLCTTVSHIGDRPSQHSQTTDPRIYLLQKEILSLQEACAYLCISLFYMYKLTSARRIPHYSPTGKLLYFKRTELDGWVLQHRRVSDEELEDKALGMLLKRK